MEEGSSSKRMDILNGSIGNKLIYFAVPLAATGILHQPYHGAIIHLFTGISIGQCFFEQPLPKSQA